MATFLHRVNISVAAVAIAKLVLVSWVEILIQGQKCVILHVIHSMFHVPV